MSKDQYLRDIEELEQRFFDGDITEDGFTMELVNNFGFTAKEADDRLSEIRGENSK